MKKFLWVVIVIVVAVAVYMVMGDKVDKLTSIESVFKSSDSKASPTPVAAIKKKVVVATPVAPAKSYTQMLKEYEGKRIQFDERCQPTPLAPTYKNGSIIMLDNRSASPKVIMIGGAKYSLAGYGYQTVTLSSPSLPNELAVSCGSAGNVGRILLQAKLLP